MVVLGWDREGGILALLQLPRVVRTARGINIIQCGTYHHLITMPAASQELYMKNIAKIFSGGRITLPRQVRQKLGVGPGDLVRFKKIGTETYIYAAKKPRARKQPLLYRVRNPA